MQKHIAVYAQVRQNPRFQALVARRNRYGFRMAMLMMAVYFGYILLLAFRSDLLARPLGDGLATPLGIPLGLAVLMLAVLLTAMYVRRANREFDTEAAQIRKEALK